MLKRILVLLTVGILALSLLAPAAVARPSQEPFVRILSPTVTLREPAAPMIGPVQFRRFEEIRVRYLCHPPGADVPWQRFYVEPPFAQTSPYGDPIECDGKVRNTKITVPIGVDPYGPTRQIEPLTVRFGHLMEVSDSRDLRVRIRFDRFQGTVASVAPATFGSDVMVTFEGGGAMSVPTYASAPHGRLTVDGRPATLTQFVAALSPGDRLVARGPQIALRNR
jgi:hypothetical protein